MRSDVVKKGMQTAPQRSLFNALGLTEEELERPLVGIVSSYNEIVPGHMNIDKIVEAVKTGVAMAGGTPIVFPAIAVCDGIAMGHMGMKYSLVTRDLIADSTECMALAHQFANIDYDVLLYDPKSSENRRGEFVANLVKESGAQGLVLFMQQFCDPEEMEYPYLKKALNDADIPHIKLGIDQQMRDFGQARTAIQAFADVLEMRK